MSENKPSVEGRNGGKLYPQQAGKPAPPGAGRKPNPFRELIQQYSDEGLSVELKGRLILSDGSLGDVVDVSVELPGAMAVVLKAYKKAAKGDSAARKWLTETGWGKSLNLGFGDDVPTGGGFVLLLPDNGR